MTGAQHYAEAEHLLAPTTEERIYFSAEQMRLHVAKAQAHATLALAAAVERQNRLAHGTDVGGYGAEVAARAAVR